MTVFLRRRNRVIGLSDAGQNLVPIAERIVKDADHMRAAAADFRGKSAGTLTVATTHLHAFDILPFLKEGDSYRVQA